jgi:hypothetical protein
VQAFASPRDRPALLQDFRATLSQPRVQGQASRATLLLGGYVHIELPALLGTEGQPHTFAEAQDGLTFESLLPADEYSRH